MADDPATHGEVVREGQGYPGMLSGGSERLGHHAGLHFLILLALPRMRGIPRPPAPHGLAPSIGLFTEGDVVPHHRKGRDRHEPV